MKTQRHPPHPAKRRRGFTLPEVMIALSLSGIVMATVMAAYIWTGRQASLCGKIAWSQSEAMRTSRKIESYLRGAQSIYAFDYANGNWIQVRFPGGVIGTLFYYDPTGTLRRGRMYLFHGNRAELLVARGLTRLMDSTGGPLPMFSLVGDKGIRVAYRVSEPTSTGVQAADDGLFASSVSFAVCMRNFISDD